MNCKSLFLQSTSNIDNLYQYCSQYYSTALNKVQYANGFENHDEPFKIDISDICYDESDLFQSHYYIDIIQKCCLHCNRNVELDIENNLCDECTKKDEKPFMRRLIYNCPQCDYNIISCKCACGNCNGNPHFCNCKCNCNSDCDLHVFDCKFKRNIKSILSFLNDSDSDSDDN